MGVNKPFENVSCLGRRRIQKFFGEGHQLRHFFKRRLIYFPAELILSNLSNKNDFREVRGHAPSENF